MKQIAALIFIPLFLMGFWYSTVAVLAAVILAFCLRYCARIWLGILFVIGLLFLGTAWWLFSVSPILVHQFNAVLLQHFFYHQPMPYTPFILLSTFPYALSFSTLFAYLFQQKSNLQKELQRVGQGKMATTERWLTTRQLQKRLTQLSQVECAQGSYLGVHRQTGAAVQLDDRDANLHTLAIGTTGSGKTTAIANIIESVIQRRYPVFYVDGKGDLSLATAIERFAQSQHVPFYLFSMVGPSLAYNPLASGGYTSKKDRIIELRNWSEDHYRKIAEGYLQTVFKALEKTNQNIDLFSLSQYLTPEALYRLARSLKDLELKENLDALESSFKDIRSLIYEIKNIADSEIGRLFDCSKGNAIHLKHVLEERGVVYFCLQPLAFPAYAETLGKLIINDLKALLASQLDQSKPQKIFAVFDEFSVFAGDQIIHLINQGRGAGLHAVLATQSLSDIQRKGGDALLGQVLNNTNNYIIQRQNYPEDAEVLANIIGTKQGFEVTSQLLGNKTIPEMGTVRQTRRFIIHPDEIKRLGLGEAIFVNKQRFCVQEVLVRRGRIF